MPGNAPEELRERVDELEATVRGLTQELVEANERIRRLEEETGAAGETRRGYDDEGADKPMPAEDGGTDERDAAEGDDGEDDDGAEDDIIVA